MPGHNNGRAIELITNHIRQQLDNRSRNFREHMATPHINAVSDPFTSHGRADRLRLIVLPQTPQLKVCYPAWISTIANTAQGIMTILRDSNTPRGEFIFFTDRLSTILAEKATQLLPHRAKVITTPLEVEAVGSEIDATVLTPHNDVSTWPADCCCSTSVVLQYFARRSFL